METIGCWLIFRKRDVFIFKNVVGDNIFMVADVTDNGALRYLTAPFYVSPNGEVHLFIPQPDQKFSYTFDKQKKK